ncbi:hypothetical protein A2Z33_07445 [Candidatus Gottesmanbacteria bacterium RBG_16_52_11]|uniref:EamA domain-containing protein n=1 Tax=Candidatus Gottesmanbacteria bacterium RBG_16_52_11 TaxID=1798374 RepID=A0A1F5YN33_9BACT|nr:MAG: hypothetical protein A2Z33_07445 [Candidatus Gottesmanbacteria bacterium RBG_16_52_11]
MLAAALLWSTAGVTTKVLLRVIPPYMLAYIRFAIAGIIMLPLLMRSRIPNIRHLALHIIPVSLLGSGNILFFYLGIERTTVHAASMIYTAQTLIVAVLAYILIRERISRRKLIGVLTGFAGVAVITLIPALQKGASVSGDLTGNICIIAATVCWSLYTIGSRQLLTKYDYSARTLTAVSILTSAAVFGIATAIRADHFPWVTVLRPANAVLLLHLAVMLTVVTYLLYQWAIKHSSAVTASLVQYLQPVASIALAIVFLGERLSWGFVLGSLLVFAGLYLTSGLTPADLRLRRG